MVFLRLKNHGKPYNVDNKPTKAFFELRKAVDRYTWHQKYLERPANWQ